MPLPTWLIRTISLILVVCLAAPPGAAPAQSQIQGVTFRVFAPFWKLGQGFDTTLILRNRHLKSVVSATPVLYTLDGGELRLTTVKLAPNSAQMVSLGKVLAATGNRARSGAIALEYQGPNAGTFAAQLRVKNVTLSLVFDLPFLPGVGVGTPQVLDAPWWLRDKDTKGTLVLFNTSSTRILAHPSVTVAQTWHPLGDTALGPHEVRQLNFRSLLRENGIHDATLGLLNLSYDGPAFALMPALLFANEQTGYSLTASFDTKQASESGHPAAFYVPSVSINRPDPSLGFSGDIQFTPYALLSNTSGAQLAVQLNASYELAGQAAPQTVTLPVAPLAPLETRVLNLGDYVAQGLIPKDVSDISLELSHTGAMGDLSFQIFSVDQTGNFVFGAEAKGPSFRNDVVYWTTQGNEDTMMAIKNVSETELAVRMTLSYNDGQGSYKLPLLTIPPHATRPLDFKQVIATALPDEDGNLFPREVNFGTARIEVADGRPLDRIVITESVFDPVAGTCGSGCVICGVVVAFNLLDNPTAGTVGSTKQVSAVVQWGDGSTSDVTRDTSFSSSNTGVISVQNTPGQTGNGMASFNTVGSVNIGGSISIRGDDGSEPPPICRLICPLLFLTALIPGDSNRVASFRITVLSTPVSGETNSVVSGQSAQVKVEALDSFGGTIPGYRGTVHFSSPDPLATLPPNYTFTAADAGSHTFNITLNTVISTLATRALTVQDVSTRVSSTQSIFVWFQVVATREGLVGQTTACNGHVIVANDHFVALPSTGFCNVGVRLANGATKLNQSVLDVGPWCPHSQATGSNPCVCPNDPYWQTTGVPFAATHSCSTNGAGIDLADGTFADLGLTTNGAIYWRFQ